MKSERRHELQHNILADWLITTYKKVKPYQNAIMGVVLLLAVVMFAYSFWKRQSSSRAADAWLSLDQAAPLVTASPDSRMELEKVIQQHNGTEAACWASLRAADYDLAQGAQRLYSHRAAANERLNDAAKGYSRALDSRLPLLRERAAFGLGRTYENLGKLDEAVKYYEQVVQQWPGGTFSQSASARLAELEKQRTRWFYDKIVAFKPGLVPPKSGPEVKPPPSILLENPPDESTPAAGDAKGPAKPAGKEKPAAESPEKSAP